MSRKKHKNTVKTVSKTNKLLLSYLPYYNCNILENAHPIFNSLVDTTSRRSLEKLCSLHDLNLFYLNPRSDLNINQDDSKRAKQGSTEDHLLASQKPHSSASHEASSPSDEEPEPPQDGVTQKSCKKYISIWQL